MKSARTAVCRYARAVLRALSTITIRALASVRRAAIGVLQHGMLVRAAISVALLIVLARVVELDRAWQVLTHADYVYVVPALALFAFARLLVAQRWRLMLSVFSDLPLFFLYGILLVSNLANNVVPVRMGDLIRVQVPAQRYSLSRARLTATVFVTESLLDGIVFTALGLIGWSLAGTRGPSPVLFWGVVGFVAVALVVVLLVSQLRLEEGWTSYGRLSVLPARWRTTLDTIVPNFIDGLAVFQNVRLGSQAIALSSAVWLSEAAMFWLFGLSFGIHLSFFRWMLVMVTANMVSSVPIAPSNIGTYEVAVTEIMAALGVSTSTAGAFAIATHVFRVLWITAAGATAMWLLGLRASDVLAPGRSTERPVERAPSAPSHESP